MVNLVSQTAQSSYSDTRFFVFFLPDGNHARIRMLR
jgi:hypothetical protein